MSFFVHIRHDAIGFVKPTLGKMGAQRFLNIGIILFQFNISPSGIWHRIKKGEGITLTFADRFFETSPILAFWFDYQHGQEVMWMILMVSIKHESESGSGFRLIV